MIFLDTHVVAFLAGKQIHKISKKCQQLIENESLWISPLVLLELNYLHKAGRIKQTEQAIFSFLKNKLSLQQSQTPIDSLIYAATSLEWTRDLFDRLIVADCIANGAKLITKDAIILEYYADAVWD